MAAPTFKAEEYTIGWICALPIELIMVRKMLDVTHSPLASQPRYDENHYHLGEIGKHKVVITCLAEYGTTSATAAAKSMQATFTQLRFGLLVGIGGGVPSPQVDIRLGDIAVSLPTEQHGGVLQYDLGRMENDSFHRKGSLNRPPKLLLSVIPTMRTTRGVSKDIFEQASRVLGDDEENDEDWNLPGALNDVLFKAESKHVAKNLTCGECVGIVPRNKRKQNWPKIHYGNIASGNTVVKSSKMRDRLGEEDDVICVEMEAAGMMNDFPCLVIRGISDYADSHKNSKWQPYAAAVATVYAKKLLQEILPTEVQTMKTVPKSYWYVPFGKNNDFVGRKDELQYLITNLNPENEDNCQRVAVSGLGGIGKTQIALEAVFQIKEKFSDLSVFWVPAIDVATFERAYQEIGQKLEIPGINDDKADIKLLVKAFLSQEKFGRWLMVIDNADDLRMFFHRASESDEYSASPALVDYLPSSRRGSILFTTRNHQVAVKHAGNIIVRLVEMSKTESQELFEKCLFNKSLTRDKEVITKLLNLLSDLPLAIKQAAAFLNENNSISVSEYLEIYNSNNEEVVDLLSEDFEAYGRYSNPNTKNPIASTWWISFRQIQQIDKLAATYLSFMSCVAQQDIPLQLLPPARRLEQTKSLGTLKAYTFITERVGRKSYDIHRLVQLAARNWLKKENTLSSWSLKVLERVAEVFPFFQHKEKDQCTLLLPHTQYVIQFQRESGDCGESSWNLLFNVGVYFLQTGKYLEAERMYRQVLELNEKVLGLEHPDTLASINNLALVLRNQGKYEEAETLHRETLELREKVLGLEHPDTLRSINNLAEVLRNQGKYKEAETLHRETLELNEKVLGLEHLDTLASINNLALVLDSQGKYEEAETIRQSFARESTVQDVNYISKEEKNSLSTNPLATVFSPPLAPPAPNPKPAHLSLSRRRIPPEKPLKPSYLKGA